MNIERIVPSLEAAELRRTVDEHIAVLGQEVVMDHGWIVTLADSHGHQLSIVAADATAPQNPDVSVFVDDVESAYARALAAGVVIVHPLTAEEWGVTRFFYRDGSRSVINVGMHARRASTAIARCTETPPHSGANRSCRVPCHRRQSRIRTCRHVRLIGIRG